MVDTDNTELQQLRNAQAGTSPSTVPRAHVSGSLFSGVSDRGALMALWADQFGADFVRNIPPQQVTESARALRQNDPNGGDTYLRTMSPAVMSIVLREGVSSHEAHVIAETALRRAANHFIAANGNTNLSADIRQANRRRITTLLNAANSLQNETVPQTLSDNVVSLTAASIDFDNQRQPLTAANGLAFNRQTGRASQVSRALDEQLERNGMPAAPDIAAGTPASSAPSAGTSWVDAIVNFFARLTGRATPRPALPSAPPASPGRAAAAPSTPAAHHAERATVTRVAPNIIAATSEIEARINRLSDFNNSLREEIAGRSGVQPGAGMYASQPAAPGQQVAAAPLYPPHNTGTPVTGRMPFNGAPPTYAGVLAALQQQQQQPQAATTQQAAAQPTNPPRTPAGPVFTISPLPRR